MIAFTKLTIFATCLGVSEHLHNVLTVASFNQSPYGNLFVQLIALFLGFVVLPAMLMWLFTTGWRGKK